MLFRSFTVFIMDPPHSACDSKNLVWTNPSRAVNTVDDVVGDGFDGFLIESQWDTHSAGGFNSVQGIICGAIILIP